MMRRLLQLDELTPTVKLEWTVMLCLYDETDWSDLDWTGQALVLRSKGQMKWWFLKRFAWPGVVAAYRYLLVVDEDADFGPRFDPVLLLDIMQRNRVQFAQPALLSAPHLLEFPILARSNLTLTSQRLVCHLEAPVGRWTNFIQSTSALIFSSMAYSSCIWPLVAEDLVTGAGLDRVWFSFCSGLGLNRFAMYVCLIPSIAFIPDYLADLTHCPYMSLTRRLPRLGSLIRLELCTILWVRLQHINSAILSSRNHRKCLIPPAPTWTYCAESLPATTQSHFEILSFLDEAVYLGGKKFSVFWEFARSLPLSMATAPQPADGLAETHGFHWGCNVPSSGPSTAICTVVSGVGADHPSFERGFALLE